MALIKCKECGEAISKKAESCPHCGYKNQPGIFSRIIFAVAKTVLFIAIITFAIIKYAEIERDAEQQKAAATAAKLKKKSDYFTKNKTSIIADIEKKIANKKYKLALIQIDAYKHTGDPDLLKHENIAREKNLVAELKTIPESKINENLKRYQQLVAIAPNNKKYQAKLKHYQQKKQAAEKKERDRIRRLGEKPHLAWSGGYMEVDRYLEKTAHDPDSIDVQRCSDIYYNDTGWLVQCTYRGKNMLGAYIINTNWFRIRHGIVVETLPPDAYSL